MSILLYNSDKKELIAVFTRWALAGRYLYPYGTTTQRTGGDVERAFRRGGGMKNTRLPCRVVVRQNTSKDDLLNGKDYWIADGYQPFEGNAAITL